MGTYSQLGPDVEAAALERLGLHADSASTQIVQRDRHAAFLAAIAVTGGTLERFAVEIRNLQHTEIGEVQEPFRTGQTGSSAMPHKRNPILSERLTGLSRDPARLRPERPGGPGAVARTGHQPLLGRAHRAARCDHAAALHAGEVQRRLVTGLVVRPERMAENIERGLGLHASSRLLTALIDTGLTRQAAYAHRAAQRHARR